MVAMRVKLVLSLLSAASALRMGGVGETPTTVADVKYMIESAPQDIDTQTSACRTLGEISFEDRSSEEKSPFFGKYIPTKFLEEGIGEVYAQAILNILVNEKATEKEIGDAAQFCVYGNGLQNIMQVQNNKEKGLALFRNSPHYWDAILGFEKRFWKTYEPKGSCMDAGLFGTFPGSEVVANDWARAGGVELVLDWIDHGRTDPDTLQNALCALSDNIQAGKDVADAIVRLGGAKLFTEAVRSIHAAPNQDAIGHGYSLHYQVLEDIIGMLKHDDDNRRYAKAFIDAGLIDAVVEYMPDDQADLYFQDHCCQTLGWLANVNVTVQRKLKESATLRTHVEGALDLHCKPNCRWPSGFEFAYGAEDHVKPPPACEFLLNNLESGDDMPWEEWSEFRRHA